MSSVRSAPPPPKVSWTAETQGIEACQQSDEHRHGASPDTCHTVSRQKDAEPLIAADRSATSRINLPFPPQLPNEKSFSWAEPGLSGQAHWPFSEDELGVQHAGEGPVGGRRLAHRRHMLMHWVPLLINMLLSMAVLALVASAPCSVSELVSGDQECGPRAAVMRMADMAKTGVQFFFTGQLFITRVLKLTKQQLFKGGSRRCLGSDISPAPQQRGWTPAASPRILLESCRVLRDEMWLVVIFFSICAWTAGISEAVSGLPVPEALAMEQVCGAKPGPCTLAFHAMGPLLVVSVVYGMMMIMFCISAPLEIWNPVVYKGLRLMGSASLGIRTLTVLPWLSIPGMALAAALLANFKVATSGLDYSQRGIIAQAVLSLVELVYILVVVLFMLIPDPDTAQPLLQDEGLSRPASETDLSSRQCCRLPISWTRRLPQKMQLLLRPVNSSRDYRVTTFLFLAQVVWSMPTVEAAVVGTVIIWLLRIVPIAAILAVREMAIDHKDLEQHRDPGLGLVINAKHLAAALTATASGSKYNGPLETYKASIWRMPFTMAVSYRWQSDERVHLSDNLYPLNMSKWQVGALLSELQVSSADYCWIDCLAVPQEASLMQRTLLARMMAVYASAGISTLVLRSSEEEGHRYHQRAWTLQEFCSSQLLKIHTEEVEAGEIRGRRRSSFVGQEVSKLMGFRRWHMSRMKECMPYWICKDDNFRFQDRDKMQAIVQHYQELADLVHCTVEEDKLRALFPLVANMPVEDQKEIVELVTRAHDGAGADTPPLIRALRLRGSATLARALQTGTTTAADGQSDPKLANSEVTVVHIS